MAWHLGILLVNLVQHSNPRTVTPLDEVKKSSLCAQASGWWKDYLESPCASWEWGEASHGRLMRESYDRSQIPPINHQNHHPRRTAGKVSVLLQVVGWEGLKGQSKGSFSPNLVIDIHLAEDLSVVI